MCPHHMYEHFEQKSNTKFQMGMTQSKAKCSQKIGQLDNRLNTTLSEAVRTFLNASNKTD